MAPGEDLWDVLLGGRRARYVATLELGSSSGAFSERNLSLLRRWFIYGAGVPRSYVSGGLLALWTSSLHISRRIRAVAPTTATWRACLCSAAPRARISQSSGTTCAS